MAPRVSIGLPVFDGERFLGDAIASVLAQTFEDFELLVADNGSTDGTARIAAEASAHDARIRHIRHEQNHGARWNFNTVFAEATGELFAWLAHDDRWEPRFLERCVAALDADAGAVLAFSDVAYIDEHGRRTGSREMRMRTDSDRVEQRLWDVLLCRHDCLPVFGVVRADVLRRTGLIRPYASGDHVLLAELALAGRFALLDEHLFSSRRHAGQSIQRYDIWVDHHAYTEWFHAPGADGPEFPAWASLRDLVATVARAGLEVGTTVRCLTAVVRWTLRYRRLLIRDVQAGVRTAARRRAGRTEASIAAISRPGGDRPSAPPSDGKPPVITVCIPTVRPATIVAAVESVRRQTLRHWELLVIVQGGDAELRRLVEELQHADGRVRAVHTRDLGASRARNRALELATTDVVAFLDDDCEADPAWLEHIVDALRADASVGMVAGTLAAIPAERRWPSVCPSVSPADFTHRPRGDERALPSGADFASANLTIRKAAWRRTGGFDEELGPGATFAAGEDLDLVLRAMRTGVAVRFLPSAVVHHTSGRRYGIRALYALTTAYGRGQGAVAAKMCLEPGEHGPEWDGAAWRRHMWQHTVDPARRARPDRIVRGLPRLLGFERAFRCCMRDYAVEGERLVRRRAASADGGAAGAHGVRTEGVTSR